MKLLVAILFILLALSIATLVICSLDYAKEEEKVEDPLKWLQLLQGGENVAPTVAKVSNTNDEFTFQFPTDETKTKLTLFSDVPNHYIREEGGGLSFYYFMHLNTFNQEDLENQMKDLMSLGAQYQIWNLQAVVSPTNLLQDQPNGTLVLLDDKNVMQNFVFQTLDVTLSEDTKTVTVNAKLLFGDLDTLLKNNFHQFTMTLDAWGWLRKVGAVFAVGLGALGTVAAVATGQLEGAGVGVTLAGQGFKLWKDSEQ